MSYGILDGAAGLGAVPTYEGLVRNAANGLAVQLARANTRAEVDAAVAYFSAAMARLQQQFPPSFHARAMTLPR